MTAVSFFVDSSSKYNPIIGADSINFNDSKYAVVKSNEKYSGNITLTYTVQITEPSYDQYRFRPTMQLYSGLGDFGFFKQSDYIRLFYNSQYHENIGYLFTVKEEYNTVNNTFVFTIKMYYSPYVEFATVSGTLNYDQIQLFFGCGDGTGYYAYPTNITNIRITGDLITNKARSFGMII